MTNLKEIQSIVKKWTDEKGFRWSDYAHYCHLVEEIGELGEALTVEKGERQKGSGEKGLADHANLPEEIGDVFFTLVSFANRFDIDLDICLESTLKRYDSKIRKKAQ